AQQDVPAEATEAPPAQPTGVQEGKIAETNEGEGTPIKMPALGESVTEGTVTPGVKGVGDRGEADEPLLEVSTDKVDTEIPSPIAGVLTRIVVQEDDTVPVGGELAVIGGSSASAPAPQQAPQQEAPRQESAPAPQQAQQ